jgi:hypothetical protein
MRNGTAMSQLMQQEALGNEYFGNPDDDDSVGLCEQLFKVSASLPICLKGKTRYKQMLRA